MDAVNFITRGGLMMNNEYNTIHLEDLESIAHDLDALYNTIFIFENAFHQMHLDQFSISAMNSLQHTVNDIKSDIDQKIQGLLEINKE